MILFRNKNLFTCHDSTAVGSCAKFHSDYFTKIATRPEGNVHLIWIWKSFAEISPMQRAPCSESSTKLIKEMVSNIIFRSCSVYLLSSIFRCPGKQLYAVITPRKNHEKLSVDGQLLRQHHEWACMPLWANVMINIRQNIWFFIFQKILKYGIDLVCAFTVISKKN